IYTELQSIRDRYGSLIRARFPQIPRRVSGYNLDELLPEHGFHVARALVGIGYEDAFVAADHVPEILEFQPIGLEGFEGSIVDGLRSKGAPHIDLLPDGRGILLVEFGSDDPLQIEATANSL